MRSENDLSTPRKRTGKPAWIRRAYLESIVSAQCSSGNGEAHIIRGVHIPSWFVREELGLGAGHTSITGTFASLEQINRRNKAIFERGSEFAEPVKKQVRRTAKAYQKAARRVLKYAKVG